ncbi:MAG: hypothetical protein QOG50_3934 [Actinomycetota bacterium]|nr:hypothetical protein [Actinomycetota bacterium]
MDDFEREVREMLNDRVAAMPTELDASPAFLTRARRRRASKLAALAVSVVIVAGGTADAIAQVAGGDRPQQVTTSTPTSTVPRSSVRTVACPVNTEVRNGQLTIATATPTTGPRVPEAGEPALLSTLESFAAIDDPRYVVLGPDSWSCLATFANVANRIVVYDPQATPGKVPGLDAAPINVQNAILWNEPARALACSVFDDPLFRQPTNSCVTSSSSHRTVTRVDAHLATFVDADGVRGVGWLELPSSETANDGKISVLTCRPTKGLTTATCDTIIADYAARLSSETSRATTTTTTPSTTTTTTTTKPATVATVACPITYTLTPSTPLPAPSIDAREPAAGDPSLFQQLASYAATTDPRYVVLGPNNWKCETTIAADGQNGMVVSDPAGGNLTPYPDVATAPIGILNDWLWHGDVGSSFACSVFDDPALVQYLTQGFPSALPCPKAGRTVTRVDAHVATFVDADGTHGAGWMILPSSRAVDDGKFSELTCRPTGGLTTAECDTIIADWIARNDT